MDALPFALRWLVEPVASTDEAETLTIEAGPRTDMFVSPQGDPPALNAPALVGGPVAGDFTLSACVQVPFAASFDAGALLLYGDATRWAKLCFEFSPQREAMVVSVVTRGVSDDANGSVVAGDTVWLRVARVGSAYAFHSSLDGETWSFARHFALDGELEAGFVAQSPTGEGCAVRFTDVRFEQRTLGDLRDGS
jgi:regulation of enolase protein 1 (concanavalin A-like superfamily)